MSGGNHVSAQFASGFKESIELDLPVAENVRVRSASGGILIEPVVNNPLAILLASASCQFCMNMAKTS